MPQTRHHLLTNASTTRDVAASDELDKDCDITETSEETPVSGAASGKQVGSGRHTQPRSEDRRGSRSVSTSVPRCPPPSGGPSPPGRRHGRSRRRPSPRCPAPPACTGACSTRPRVQSSCCSSSSQSSASGRTADERPGPVKATVVTSSPV